jgi:hypothetical protein
MMQQDFQATHWQALTALWRQQQLTDVHIRASSGEVLAAHSIVLASASGFFRYVCFSHVPEIHVCQLIAKKAWHMYQSRSFIHTPQPV